MKPLFGYWDVRGRVNAIRMLLHYAGVDFEDKRYNDYQEWFQKDKIDLQGKLDFPNLPYYIDEDVKITQTQAILEYLGRKHNLDGTSEAELVRMKMIHEQVLDLQSALGSIAYPPNTENKRDIHDLQRKAYVAALHVNLAAIVEFLGSNVWMGASRLTYVDFFIYDILDLQRRLFDPKHINEFPTLIAYLKRIETLKGVKEYLESDAFKPLPIFGPFASFGQTADYKPTE